MDNVDYRASLEMLADQLNFSDMDPGSQVTITVPIKVVLQQAICSAKVLNELSEDLLMLEDDYSDPEREEKLLAYKTFLHDLKQTYNMFSEIIRDMVAEQMSDSIMSLLNKE